MRLARDAGDISSIFPPGITRLIDLPYTIHDALLSALGFLSFDELPEKERPPKRIWLDGEKLDAWFAEVKRVREAEIAGHGDQGAMERNGLVDRLLIGFEN